MQKNKDLCWSCMVPCDDFFFCKNCSKIQKPKSLDDFKIFSLPYDYDINFEKLEKCFLNLQLKLHPDKFVNSDEKEKLFSGIHSANINESYNTIVDPIRRAGALLKILIDFDLKEKTINDKEILFEIMELEEEKEMISCYNDSLAFIKKINKLIKDDIKDLTFRFKNQDFLMAKKIYTKLSYFNKIKRDLKTQRV